MIATNRSAVVLLRTDLLRYMSHTEALLLNQLDYYLDSRGHLIDGHYWYRSTESDWGRQLGLSRRQVGRAIEHLIELGLVEKARANHHAYDRTWSYRICYERLTELTGIEARHVQHVNTAREPKAATRRTPAEKATRRDYIAALEEAYAAERAERERTEPPIPDFRDSPMFARLSPSTRAIVLAASPAYAARD